MSSKLEAKLRINGTIVREEREIARKENQIGLLKSENKREKLIEN